MASLDDVLKGNLRGFRRETGQPAEEIAVEEPAIDEVEPPQLYDERAEYRGFKVPAGMDAEQTERWFGAIDAREDEREAAEAEAEAEFEAESGFTTQLLGSLERTVMKDNPRMGAKAVEGLGRVAGSQAMIDFGSKTAAEYDTSDDPAAFSPRIESIYDAEGFQDYIDYAGSTLGQGVASIGTMAAGGAVGAAAGAPFGASGVTARVGAVATGFMMNYGDLYDTFVEQEGMDPDDAAKYAIVPAAMMAGLDAFGLEKLVKPARDALSDNFAKRTAQLAIRGGGTEAVTEAAQQVVQESAGEIAEVTGLATEDIEFSQRFENVVNALVAGFIPGFALGGTGAARVRPEDDAEDDAPAPPAAPEPTVLTQRVDVPAEVPDAATAGAETESEIAEARRLWQELGIESPYFKRKFGNTKVTDDDGKPLAVFHGTSGDFDQFRPGSPEGAFGSAIYTSSSSDDVNVNYATAEGSDIKNRVDQAIDSIDSLDDFDDDDILDAAKQYMDRTESTDTELLEAIKAGDVEKLKDELEPDLIEQLARQQVLGDEAFSVLKTYVNIENPVYLDPSGTKGRTTFDLEIEYDDDGEFVGESGSVLELLQTIDDVADNFETSPANARNLKQFIVEKASDYGEVDAFDIFREVRDGDYYFESDTGGYANSEFIRQVFEQMGFDGIIADAYHFFGPRDGSKGFQKLGMAGITPGTYHYMAFKPEQIKSATGNVGTFDPSGNILKSTAEGAQFIGLAGMGVNEAIDLMSRLRTGQQLADFITKFADDLSYREISERIRPHLENVGLIVLTEDIGNLPPDFDPVLGSYLRDMGSTYSSYGIRGLNLSDEKSNDVILRGRRMYTGCNAETALHELIHAASTRRLEDGLLKENKGTDVAKAAQELVDLHKQVERIIRKRRKKKKVDPEFDSILKRGLENVHEFVAYGMTNKKFQEFLMTIGSRNRNLWNTFVEKISNLLGIGKDKRSVLTDLIRVTDELLTADLGQLRSRLNTQNINMSRIFNRDVQPSTDVDSNTQIVRQSATTSNVIGFGDLSAYQAIDEIKKVETGKELIDFIIDRADNPAYKVIAERIRPFLDKTMVATISKIEDVPRSIMLAIDDGDLEASTFDLLLDMSRENTRTGTRGVTITTPEDVDIVLRGHADFSGATAEVALHEAIHAATQNRIADGQLKQNRKTELGKATAELAALHKRVKKILKKRKTQKGSAPADPKLFDVVLEYGLEDLNEFVSYGMTNKTFQDFLMSIESENKSLWNTFVEKVANLLGIENQTVLTDLIRVTDQILSADVEELPARVRTRFINRMLGSDQDTEPSLLGGSNPVFESELEKIILNQTPNKIGVDDIEQFLNKKGAKKSEIADTKIPEFVEQAKASGKKSVTKDELIQHLEDDKVQIKEVRLDRNRREAPQYLKDSEIAAQEAFKDIIDDVRELSLTMEDPSTPTSDSIHRYSNNPDYFRKMYFDAVDSATRTLYLYLENIPRDVFLPVEDLVNLIETEPIKGWGIDDVEFITRAKDAVAAKLKDPEYKKFIDEQFKFLSESKLNDFAPAIITRKKKINGYRNLLEINRILSKIENAAPKFSAMEKFESIPNVKKYLKLKKQYLKQEESFFKKDKRFNPRWDSYTIPEGENYQEILITVPMSPKEKRARAEVKRLNLAEVDLALEQETVRGSFLQSDLPLSPEMQNITDELRLAESNLKKVQSKPFNESHHEDFDNVMVHIRTKDRRDSKGRKILFVEEIQSDWHQKGRKRGYTQEENDAKMAEATDKLLDLEFARNEAYRMPDGEILNERHTISDEEYTARNEAYREGEILVRKQKDVIVGIRKGPVPDAPLKDTKEWMSLAIKRIFREASEQGYDGVAFTRSDLITPIVSLDPGATLSILTSGSPAKALMSEIERLKKSGRDAMHHNNLGEEVERIYGGNKYIYDKLIPSIAKKESKAKQETTYIEMMETGFLEVGKPRTPGGPPRTEVMQTTLDRLVRDGGVVEVPFFELTDKVKDRVSKPQKLYSLALPALVVGAAASEEEELSPAAALMSLGKAGMALYRKLTGSDEEGNPAEELAPMRLSERSYSPVDSIVTYTDVGQSKAEFDRRREMANKYEPMLFELMKMEADFYEMDEDSDKAKELGARYEDLLKQYEKIDDDLFSDEYERFLKGTDYYYETSEEGIENFDVDRAFNVMNPGSDIEMDINLRTTQEMMQRKRFDRMMERGGTLVDLAGQNSSINRLIVQKAQAFNHPVQTVQLNESDKMFLEKDLSNLEELKEDGLISYLLYKELKGDVMLF